MPRSAEREAALSAQRKRQKRYSESRRWYGIPTAAQVHRAITRAARNCKSVADLADLSDRRELIWLDALIEEAIEILAAWGHEPGESRRLVRVAMGNI